AQLPPSPCSSLRNSRPRSAPNSRRRPTPNRSFSAPRRGAWLPYSATLATVGRHCCLRMESALSHEMGTGDPSLDDPADANSTNGTNGTGTATLTEDDLPETVHLPRQMRIEDEDTDEEISAKLRRHGARIGKGMVAPAVFWPAIIAIVGVVAFAVIAPETTDKVFNGMNDWIVANLGWWYMLVVGVFVVVAIGIGVSKYGKIRLGRDDEKPEVGLLCWFALRFAAGM